MKSRAGVIIERIVAWTVIAAVAVWIGRLLWIHNDPWNHNPLFVTFRVHSLMAQLASRNPGTAARAWYPLRSLYLSKWRAVHIVARHFSDQRRIHFRLVGPSKDVRTLHGPMYARRVYADSMSRDDARAWFDSAGHRYWEECPPCSTLGDALIAMASTEDTPWRTPLECDAQEWLVANKDYYPLSAHFTTGGVEKETRRKR